MESFVSPTAFCPLCHCHDVRYTFRVRRYGWTIAVTCEHCRYIGPEVRMENDEDVTAANQAARAWNVTSQKLAGISGWPESRAIH